jgi:hypothetical protein
MRRLLWAAAGGYLAAYYEGTGSEMLISRAAIVKDKRFFFEKKNQKTFACQGIILR